MCSVVSLVFFLKDIGVSGWLGEKLSFIFGSNRRSKTSLVDGEDKVDSGLGNG